jgi:hypothetical protein
LLLLKLSLPFTTKASALFCRLDKVASCLK